MAPSDLDAVFAAHLVAARTAWPDLDVPEAEFRAHLARHAPGEFDRAKAMRAADLYLCCACAAGNPRALAAFERSYFGEITAAATRAHLGSGSAEEAAAQLRTQLFVGSQTRPPLVAGFSGRGDLRGWLRVAATRTVGRLAKLERREVRVTDEGFLDVLAPSGDPELGFLKNLYREQLAAAFKAALAATPAREKSLLRFSLLDGLSIDEIGGLHGVHRATAARWIAKARDGILGRLRAGLMASLNVDSQEVDSLLRLVHSRIGVSLAGALESK